MKVICQIASTPPTSSYCHTDPVHPIWAGVTQATHPSSKRFLKNFENVEEIPKKWKKHALKKKLPSESQAREQEVWLKEVWQTFNSKENTLQQQNRVKVPISTTAAEYHCQHHRWMSICTKRTSALFPLSNDSLDVVGWVKTSDKNNAEKSLDRQQETTSLVYGY